MLCSGCIERVVPDIGRNIALRIEDILIDNGIQFVETLSVDTTLVTKQGRAFDVSFSFRFSLLQIFRFQNARYLIALLAQFGIIIVPSQGVGDVESKQVTGFVREFVGDAENGIRSHLYRFRAFAFDDVTMRMSSLERFKFLRAQHVALFVLGASDGGVVHGHIVHGFGKVNLFGRGQLRPIPVADGVVHAVGNAFYLYTVGGGENAILVGKPHEVGMQVVFDTDQFNLSVGAGRDGERNVHRLGISLSRACISRQILVIDIEITTQIPIVSR